MKSHLFGAVSSMGCANIGIKGIADDYEHMYGKDTADFIRDCFYVDDDLCSVSSEEHAADLIKRSIAICEKGKIELAKFVCSSSVVLKSLDRSLIASKVSVDFSEPVKKGHLECTGTSTAITFSTRSTLPKKFTQDAKSSPRLPVFSIQWD